MIKLIFRPPKKLGLSEQDKLCKDCERGKSKKILEENC